jgi:hypothetical protein
MVISLLFFGPLRFYESSQDSDVGIKVRLIVELILFAQPQLAIVVIKGFLGDTD